MKKRVLIKYRVIGVLISVMLISCVLSYFGIEQSIVKASDEDYTDSWIKAQQGSGWDYITSITETSSNGVIGVGTISAYESDDEDSGANVGGTSNLVSLGDDDGIIACYTNDGVYSWSATFGGTYEDGFNKIILTEDGGYAIAGYTSSYDVYYNGSKISELSIDSSNEYLQNKDGILIKISSSGSYEWGIRIGGTYDDEITSVVETSAGNFAITGTYYSDTFYFYGKGASAASISKGNSYANRMNGFVALYTSEGAYSWSQNISGTYDNEVVDIIETTAGLAIAVNHISTVYLDTDKSTSQSGASTSYVNGTVVGYSLDGTYSWRYRFYPSSASYNVAISSLSVGVNDEIYVAVNHAYILYGSLNAGTAETIYSSSPSYYAGSVVELTNTGKYTQTAFTIDGTYDDYISDVFGTYDDGILISGWFYSTSSFTVGDYTFSAVTGTYTSDGFAIKLERNTTEETDDDGNTTTSYSYDVAYAKQYAGDGYDNISAAYESSSGCYYVGGSTTSSTFTGTKLTSDDDNSTGTESFTSSGNADGFISHLFDRNFYTITVNYYLKDTTTALADSDTIGGENGHSYNISGSDEINSSLYSISSVDGNTSGTFSENATVTFYYEENTVSVEITKVSSETDENGDYTYDALQGVSFSLYKQICSDSHDDDLIDTNNVSETCWSLVSTYTTDKDGIFTLSDLSISGSYRLIETKTASNYLLPTGQWKIEFEYGQELTGTTITKDGVIMQITAIENPPAFSLQTVTNSDGEEEDVLYLFNNLSYTLPSAGTKINNAYIVGIAIIAIGATLMYIRKRRIVANSKANHARIRRRKRFR